MSFKHTAPVKTKNLCDLLTMVNSVLTSEHYEASKTMMAQVISQAEELKKDIEAEVEAQLQADIVVKGENVEPPVFKNDDFIPPVAPAAPAEPVPPVV